MKLHGTNRHGEAICGQANAKLVLLPKEVTCRKCEKLLAKSILKAWFGK